MRNVEICNLSLVDFRTSHRPDLVQKGLDQTISDLDVGYLDLYLMHWPVSSSPSTKTTQIDYIDVCCIGSSHSSEADPRV